MLSLISHVPTRRLLLRDAPTMVSSLFVADLFYKWHSFLLEAGGFLLTWLVLDVLVTAMQRLASRHVASRPHGLDRGSTPD
jgi:hypothetical protein